MNIEYSDSVKQWPEGYELVQQATADLEKVLGPKYAPHMSGRWERSGGEGAQSKFTLRLRNPDGETAGQFDMNDLQSPTWRVFTLRGLWDDLLGQRIEQHLRNLRDEGDGNAA